MGGGSVLDGSGTLWFLDVENAPIFLSTLSSDPQDGHQRLSAPAGGGSGSTGRKRLGDPPELRPPRGAPRGLQGWARPGGLGLPDKIAGCPVKPALSKRSQCFSTSVPRAIFDIPFSVFICRLFAKSGSQPKQAGSNPARGAEREWKEPPPQRRCREDWVQGDSGPRRPQGSRERAAATARASPGVPSIPDPARGP